jgi:hypothetical protein
MGYQSGPGIVDEDIEATLANIRVDWASNANEAAVYKVDPPAQGGPTTHERQPDWSDADDVTEAFAVEDVMSEATVSSLTDADLDDEGYFGPVDAGYDNAGSDAAGSDSAGVITPVTLENREDQSRKSSAKVPTKSESPQGFNPRGTMRTWIEPVLPGKTSSSGSDLKNLFGVEWEEALVGEEQGASEKAAEARGSAGVVSGSGTKEFERPHRPAESSEARKEKSPMSKNYTEVMTRPELPSGVHDPKGTPSGEGKKVIDLHDAPSIEREKVKRKAKKRAARHDRLLDDDASYFEPDSSARRASGRPASGRGFSFRDIRFPDTGWLALLTVWSVPLLLTGIFCIWSFHVDATPGLIKRAFNMDIETLPKSAPSGLALVDLTSSIVSLDDGTKVLAIEGVLFNATVETFRNVRLKARVYNKENHQLGEVRVGFSNGLINARLGALKEDAINALQEKDGAGSGEVKPNVKAPFRIVVTGLTGEEEWFSTGVLSVEAAAVANA